MFREWLKDLGGRGVSRLLGWLGVDNHLEFILGRLMASSINFFSVLTDGDLKTFSFFISFLEII